jgi:enolase
MKVDSIKAIQILDSRGNPTLEVEVKYTDPKNGVEYSARASAPSGASTGIHEACELRDGDKTKYLGKSVLKAVKNVNTEIAELLKIVDFDNQTSLDEALIKLDGTENKSRLGANAILATSLAAAKLTAQVNKKPLFQYVNELLGIAEIQPSLATPFVNILNGGVHANNGIAIQEFMIVPISGNTFEDKIQMASEVFHNLKKLLQENGYTTNVGDEGGFAPNLENTESAIELIITAIEKSGYNLNKDIGLALDAAASSFYKEEKYHIDGKALSSEELVAFLENLVKKYGIFSIEDALAEEDFPGWKLITEKLGDSVRLIGDDLFVTNERLLDKGIEEGYANSILIKPNQIGTLTETLSTIKKAYENGYQYMISHRSGETEDTTITHIAVGTNSGQIKTGSTCRGERTAKYNELIRIENGYELKINHDIDEYFKKKSPLEPSNQIKIESIPHNNIIIRKSSS